MGRGVSEQGNIGTAEVNVGHGDMVELPHELCANVELALSLAKVVELERKL